MFYDTDNTVVAYSFQTHATFMLQVLCCQFVSNDVSVSLTFDCMRR